MTLTPLVPRLVPAFDVDVRLGVLSDLGATRAGHRRIIPILGGTVSGGFEAEIETGGADWQVIRGDGAIEIDGRYTAKTTGGGIIYLQAKGIRSAEPEVLAQLARGENVPSDQYYFRTTVTVETSAPGLRHLEHRLFVASCVREATAVRYRAYEVT